MAEKPTVVEALAAVMEAVRAVGKDDRNGQQGYNFRGVDAVVNAVGPELRKHSVIVVPITETVTYRDVQTSTGKPSRECTVTVRYRFYGPAGDFIDCVTPGESMDFGDKGAPKAMSVAFRIALIQALCLPTHDLEPDSATYERAVPAQRQDAEPEQTDTVTAARSALGAHCKRVGYDLDLVAARFASQYSGADLASETNPLRVRAFIKLLDGIPGHELGVKTPNGVPA